MSESKLNYFIMVLGNYKAFWAVDTFYHPEQSKAHLFITDCDIRIDDDCDTADASSAGFLYISRIIPSVCGSTDLQNLHHILPLDLIDRPLCIRCQRKFKETIKYAFKLAENIEYLADEGIIELDDDMESLRKNIGGIKNKDKEKRADEYQHVELD